MRTKTVFNFLHGNNTDLAFSLLLQTYFVCGCQNDIRVYLSGSHSPLQVVSIYYTKEGTDNKKLAPFESRGPRPVCCHKIVVSIYSFIGYRFLNLDFRVDILNNTKTSTVVVCFYNITLCFCISADSTVCRRSLSLWFHKLRFRYYQEKV